MRHRLETAIDIGARPAEVWRVLTDLDAYREWNPFIVSAKGTVAVGEKLENRLAPPGGRPMTFKPQVTAVEPDRTFEWLGRLGVRGLFDGRHRFDLEPTPSGTRLRHTEHFNGVLVRLVKKSLDGSTLTGFNDMNRALKNRVEAATSQMARSRPSQ